MKACKPHQSVPTLRNLSTSRPTIHRRSCKPNQDSTRILVSRWSARIPQVSMTVPRTSACSRRRRRRLSSTSPSTCFARHALKAVSHTFGWSTRYGLLRLPWLPSLNPGALEETKGLVARAAPEESGLGLVLQRAPNTTQSAERHVSETTALAASLRSAPAPACGRRRR